MKPGKLLLFVSLCLCMPFMVTAQGLPEQMYLSNDLKRLYTGGQPSGGLYDETLIRSVYLTFPQANYWSLLQQNYMSKTDIPATMVVDGVTYDSVGVRFKGNTSYQGTGMSQKKSFNISLDYAHPDQKIDGYKTLNLNNAFEDPSFMREWYYLHNIRKHIPAAKAAFVKLYINGANWGLYPDVQQMNKDYLEEWFLSNDGTNWRADKPPGSPGGGGPGWGDGTAGLNYLGGTTNLYTPYYTLKSSDQANPWQDLVNGCSKLNNPPLSALRDVLPDSLDIDRALWLMASEIVYSDDDSYIYKGKMDYYVYFEPETHRLTPLEFDGNSVMKTNHVTWSPFYNENNVNYPLMNRLFAIPELRQRYLAHMRTILTEQFDTAMAFPLIDLYKTLIDTIVQNDPKKLYTYNQFQAEIGVLKSFITQRKANILSNSEVSQPAPAVANVSFTVNGVQWQQPAAIDSVLVTATATFVTGIYKMYAYQCVGVVGNFTKYEMFDDGLHGDGSAGDDVYGVYLPAVSGSQWVRYYIESIANNPARSVTYDPPGAEHDVYVYFTEPAGSSDTIIVINEIMASNLSTAADPSGEFDDWIELYNKSQQPVDISGYYLTDDSLNLDKFQIAQGTIIQPDGYLIFWADEDGSQGADHCNFKLSASGEILYLMDVNLNLVDKLVFGSQITDQGYARVPNGTGPFIVQDPTFGYNNDLSSQLADISDISLVSVYPNPVADNLYVSLKNVTPEDIRITDLTGRVIHTSSQPSGQTIILNVSNLNSGIYFLTVNHATTIRFIKI